MEPKKFFKLGLKAGDRVTVTLKGFPPVTAYFDGYKTWEHIIRCPRYDLFPIFRAVAKNGRMAKVSPWKDHSPGENFWDIISCKKKIPNT